MAQHAGPGRAVRQSTSDGAITVAVEHGEGGDDGGLLGGASLSVKGKTMKHPPRPRAAASVSRAQSKPWPPWCSRAGQSVRRAG